MSAAAAAPAPLLALCLSSLYTLFTAAISSSLTPRHYPGRDTPLESISSHCHPCHRSYGFLFWGSKIAFLFYPEYIISLSFLYGRFIAAHCNASVGGVGAACILYFVQHTADYSVILWHTQKYKIYYEKQRTERKYKYKPRLFPIITLPS